MIDQDKMRGLLARINDCTKPVDAADRSGVLQYIDALLAEVEAANSLFSEVSDYLQCVVDSSMSRNNSQNLATELLASIEKLLQQKGGSR
ncbi:hypothetical protein [Burkholderia cepacia]|uniref:hypothetical protein n=1 Tax=Burkholderia cepacia TaxID=292 RepID=UPI001F1F0ED7|nr:hypothetical protein [Burkholderia cepacia]UIY58163.1 hypothetical protein LZ568_08090 [Burkholderia cepacia]